MIGKTDLTDLTQEQIDTQPGMAHFAGTGPQHTWCADCLYLFEDHGAAYCGRYRDIMGKRGRPISPSNKSCKYYNEKTPYERANQKIGEGNGKNQTRVSKR
jgi:hypothetical protein